MAAFPDVGLVAAKLRAREVAARLEGGSVGDGRAAVVAGEKNHRVARDAGLLHGREHFANGVIGLRREIGVGVEPAFTLPVFRRGDRRVRRAEREVEEERLAGRGALANVLDRMARDGRQHVDRRDGGGHAVVFEVSLHRARVLETAVAVEAARERAVGGDRAPGSSAGFFGGLGTTGHGHGGRGLAALYGETEMPFADDGGVITLPLQQVTDGEPVGGDQRLRVAIVNALLQVRAPRVAAGQQAVARGRADGRPAVRIRKRHAFAAQPVEVRCRDFATRRVERLHIAVTEIVGEDQNNVRPRDGVDVFRRAGGDAGGRGGSEQREQGEKTAPHLQNVPLTPKVQSEPKSSRLRNCAGGGVLGPASSKSSVASFRLRRLAKSAKRRAS